MRFRNLHVCFAILAGTLLGTELSAATYHGRVVDGHWYEGRAVSTTYGAYDCRIQFHGDQVFLQVGSTQIVCLLNEDVITDPHEIVANDPRRGVDWVIDCFNLGS